MKKKFIVVLIISVCLVFVCQSGIAQFVVSNLSEFKSALSKVKAGNIITWKNGIYKDIHIDFNADGNPRNRIILKAQTAGKVIFTGSSQLMIKGTWLQAEGFLYEGTSTLEKGDVVSFSTDAMHCRITNCAIINYTPVDVMVNNNWISLQGTYNEVDHCYFKGKTNQGPYLVVRYKKEAGYVDGTDVAPSTYHQIHHNYFGYRTLPTDNGGEDMRIGDSFTSFTHGFNIIEYNYFEDHRLEAEVISNKSWNNIYRFNTFNNNDGAMVIRHGQQCFVYGNYFNGKSGRNMSGGIRIINPNNTVFNNYLENLEGGNEKMKAPITIMSGLVGSALNEYYPADHAIIAFNTVVNSIGPAIRLGVGNLSKGKPLVAPKNVWLVGNSILNTAGKSNVPIVVEDIKSTYQLSDNLYTTGTTSEKGFSFIGKEKVRESDGLRFVTIKTEKPVVDSINQRLAVHKIKLSENEITQFNPKWKLDTKDVGVSWIKY